MGMGARASPRLSAFCPGGATEALEDAPAELLDPPAAHSPISAKGATAKASVNPMTIADWCTIELSAMWAKSISRKRQPRLGSRFSRLGHRMFSSDAASNLLPDH